MGGLFLVRDERPGSAAAAIRIAHNQFARHGFSGLTERQLPGWRVLHAPYIIGGPGLMAQAGEDFAMAAGTLAYNSLMGPAALRKLLTDCVPPRFDWSKLTGQFVLLMHRQGRTFLTTDYFGAFHLYHDADMRLFSTSLLAAALTLPRVTFDRQGLYEYALQASVLGDDTVLSELKRLGPTYIVELTTPAASIHPVSKPLPGRPTAAPLAMRIASHGQLLRQTIAEHVRHFGNRVQCPLSGGLDSRLLLGVLRSLGCRPHVYVYGPANSPDVQIARQIGKVEGFEVEWIEKDRCRDIGPDEFAEQVARNFQDNDGLPDFGAIFDAGGSSYALHARHRDGALAVSGGCGEIYRNFFFLPNRRLSAAAVTDSFFARFDRRDTTGEFEVRRYVERIKDKILDALGRLGDCSPLPRSVVEQIYPRVRCRSLFGREICIDARYSPYLMPFLDHRIVSEAMTLPIRLKRAGLFEAQLLNSIDPSLASRPSAYGHDFTNPPSFWHRFDEWATSIRPIWLRKKSYVIQRRLWLLADQHGSLFSPEYMGRVIDLEFPAMRRFFRIENVTDRGLLQRIACLEYFARHLGTRLATPWSVYHMHVPGSPRVVERAATGAGSRHPQHVSEEDRCVCSPCSPY
jgi:hypothetical protein